MFEKELFYNINLKVVDITKFVFLKFLENKHVKSNYVISTK